MKNPHYLLKVLGFSAVPRLVTFGLTLVSLPLMVRALGAESYGVMVYLQSAAAVLEIVAGGGVGSAAGREVAAYRAACPREVGGELARWVWLQGWVMCFSLLPVIGAGVLLVSGQKSAEMTPAVLVIVAVTLYAAVGASFARQVLQSMLAFKWLAALDTTESVVRSSGWLLVAISFPTTYGLAVAGLVTSGIAATVGVLLVWKVMSRHRVDANGQLDNGAAPRPTSTTRHRLRASLSFMGLVIGTRAFHSVPSILIGRFAGFDYAGILGAFLRLVEIFALPFTVIGNALMVRAHEVKAGGPAVAVRYWDMLARFAIVAVGGVLAIWFLLDDIRRLLLPEDPGALHLFTLLTPLLLIRACSDLFAPASDYVGGLRARVIFLMGCATVQALTVWWTTVVHGSVAAFCVIVISQAAMLTGYVFIAKRVFFGTGRYRPPSDFAVALVLLVAAWAAGMLATGWWSLAVYGGLAAAGFLAISPLRRQYASGRFLRFEIV